MDNFQNEPIASGPMPQYQGPELYAHSAALLCFSLFYPLFFLLAVAQPQQNFFSQLLAGNHDIAYPYTDLTNFT
jgi:hypothetical protein